MRIEKKFGFSGLLENNTFLMIISLIVAISVWYGVVSKETEAIGMVQNIPVTINIEGSAAEHLGLEPVSHQEQEFNVSVEIIGERVDVGSTDADDIKVYAQLNNVTSSGTFELLLEAEVLDSNNNISVREIRPGTISLRFDHYVEKQFSVEPVTEGREVEDGYITGTPYVSPSVITVRGPSTEMDTISNVVATVTLTEIFLQTAKFAAPITLQDVNGETITAPTITISDSDAEVTLPVHKKKSLPITFEFTNVPPGFDIDSLNYTIDPPEVEIAGPTSTIDSHTELRLDYIDLSTLEPNLDLNYIIPLPPESSSIEGIKSVSITFENEEYGEKLLSVTDIRVLNAPTDFEIDVRTKTIYEILIYGPLDELENLTAKNLIAEIDMANVTINVGTTTVPVSIIIPGIDSCWAYGNEYSAVIQVNEN